MTTADPADPAPAPPRRSWRDRLPSWAPRAAFEALLIVFSVLLALSVNDWAAQRREAATIENLRGYFVEEIRANRAMLAHPEVIPHHQRLRAVFGEAARADPLTRDRAMVAFSALFSTGLHNAMPRDAVWRAASSSERLARMPLEEVFLLSDIYQQQERLIGMNDAFIAGAPALMSGLESGTGVRAAVMSVQLHLGDLVASEEGLIVLYDRALAQMGGEEAAAAASPGDGETEAG